MRVSPGGYAPANWQYLFYDDSSDNVKNYNLFWANGGTTSGWVAGYSWGANDIYDTGSGARPEFVNESEGDFSLASGSAGENAGHDGKDVGIEYNDYLKKPILKEIFTLSTQQKTGLGTSTSFTVSPDHYYKVWFYIPSSPYGGTETFNVEGENVSRNIGGLDDTFYTNNDQRYITLGRHKASDGTLNVSWSNSSSAERIFIRQFPNPDEAYDWFTAEEEERRVLVIIGG